MKKILLYATLNAHYQKGFENPIDKAILAQKKKVDISQYKNLDEAPYDFMRRRLNILVSKDGSSLMITKGALPNVLEVCTHAETEPGKIVDISEVKERIEKQYEDFSQKGLRTLGLAYKDMDQQKTIKKQQETEMTFLGFLAFYDPPKPDIGKTIESMEKLGISLKIVTGDNKFIAARISQEVGLKNSRILIGSCP